MKKWISITEADAKKRQEQEMLKKQKQAELQEYLLQQMGDQKAENGVPSILSGHRKKNKQQPVGGPMSAEELRMNKQLLKEISKKKKEKMGLSTADGESVKHQ